MLKNTPNQFVDAQMILAADGSNGIGLTVTVSVKKDGGAWGAGAGIITEGQNGSYEYEPTQAETDCDHLAIQFTEATALTQLVNLYPINVELFKADLSTIIKTGTNYRWTNSGSGAGYDNVTITEN